MASYSPGEGAFFLVSVPLTAVTFVGLVDLLDVLKHHGMPPIFMLCLGLVSLPLSWLIGILLASAVLEGLPLLWDRTADCVSRRSTDARGPAGASPRPSYGPAGWSPPAVPTRAVVDPDPDSEVAEEQDLADALVRLSDVSDELGGPRLSYAGLRTAKHRDPSFPQSVKIANDGATRLYRLEELQRWKRVRDAKRGDWHE